MLRYWWSLVALAGGCQPMAAQTVVDSTVHNTERRQIQQVFDYPASIDTVFRTRTIHDTLFLPPTGGQTGCVGIAVKPGDDAQWVVNSNPAGTTLCFAPGMYLRQSIVPRDGNTFRCAKGATLTGQDVTPYAFKRQGSGPDNVRIVGCIIEHYAPDVQMGAILAGGHAASDGTSGWTVDSSEVRYNKNLGIRLGDKMRVRWSSVHHNATLGIGGVGDDILIENTDVGFNNYAGMGVLGFEAGCTKFVLTRRLVIRGSNCHDNGGPGWWADIGNDTILIENSRAERNQQEGIVLEISFSAIIRNNTLIDNGLLDPQKRAAGYPWDAGIGVHSSGGAGIEIYGNTLTGNAHGIGLIQQARGASNNDPANPRPYLLQNVYVHDNVITCGPGSYGAAGIVQDAYGADTTMFKTRNLRFVKNTYKALGTCKMTAQPFATMNSWQTAAKWRGFGQDVAGTFTQ